MSELVIRPYENPSGEFKTTVSALAGLAEAPSDAGPTSGAPAPRWVSMSPGERIDISVLMATYARERPERLARALESIFCQSLAPAELILVKDGPVPPEQDEVIARYQADTRIGVMRVVQLEHNQGLGPALNAGLAACRMDWVMRMDTDDESIPDRIEVQTDYVLRHPDVDILGGWSEEFFDHSTATRLKTSPVDHDAIARALRWRNIMVHPSLLVRADVLRSIGGYRHDFPLLEDWDLYIRLLLSNARFAVVPKVVVRMLVGKDQAARRGGVRYLRTDIRFRTFLWSCGFVGTAHFVFTTLVYGCFRLVGPAVRNRLYKTVRIGG